MSNHVQGRRQPPRGGFTLVEMMVVVTIIGILAALILPAVAMARKTAHVAQVATDVKALASSIADFKTSLGLDPPSSIVLYETGGMNGTNWDTRSKGFIRRIWPQFDFTQTVDINGNGNANDTLTLNGAECLVFFLGGILSNSAPAGFSKNPAMPFTAPTGTGSRIGPFFEFRIQRFTDLDSDGMPEYLSPLADQSQPYWYLSSYEGTGYLPAGQADLTGNSTLTSFYYQGSINAPWNASGFQIIAPGFDDSYGTGGKYVSASSSSPASVPSSEDGDNITNFSTGMLKPK